MEIEKGWVQKAIHRLESNKKIAVVLGYKKVYTNRIAGDSK